MNDKDLSELVIAAVPATMIALVWDQVSILVQRVIERAPDDVTLEDTFNNLIEANTLLITVSRGTKIIAINILNVETLATGKRVLIIPIIAGDEMQAWIDRFMIVAKEVARDFNCTAIRGFATRKGWDKILKPRGYKQLHTVLHCELTENAEEK